MECHGSHGRLSGKIKRFRLTQIQHNQFGFGALLGKQTVQRAMDAEGIRFRDWLLCSFFDTAQSMPIPQ